jgi:hypothetical protein
VIPIPGMKQTSTRTGDYLVRIDMGVCLRDWIPISAHLKQAGAGEDSKYDSTTNPGGEPDATE